MRILFVAVLYNAYITLPDALLEPKRSDIDQMRVDMLQMGVDEKFVDELVPHSFLQRRHRRRHRRKGGHRRKVGGGDSPGIIDTVAGVFGAMNHDQKNSLHSVLAYTMGLGSYLKPDGSMPSIPDLVLREIVRQVKRWQKKDKDKPDDDDDKQYAMSGKVIAPLSFYRTIAHLLTRMDFDFRRNAWSQWKISIHLEALERGAKNTQNRSELVRSSCYKAAYVLVKYANLAYFDIKNDNSNTGHGLSPVLVDQGGRMDMQQLGRLWPFIKPIDGVARDFTESHAFQYVREVLEYYMEKEAEREIHAHKADWLERGPALLEVEHGSNTILDDIVDRFFGKDKAHNAAYGRANYKAYK